MSCQNKSSPRTAVTVEDNQFTADERADAALVVHLLGTLARRGSVRGETDAEVQLLWACTAVATDLRAHDSFSGDCLASLILHLVERSDDGALALSQREVSLRRELGDLTELAQALGRQSRVFEAMGQPEQAINSLSEAHAAAQKDGNYDLAIATLLDQARVWGTRRGNFDEALQILQRAYELSSNATRSETREWVEKQIDTALAWILRAAGTAEDAGDDAAATQHLLLVDRTALALGRMDYAARARYQHARMLAAALGRPDDALPLAESALALAREYKTNDLVPYAEQLIRAIEKDQMNR